MFNVPLTPDRRVDVAEPAMRRVRTTTVESLLVMLDLHPMSGYQLRLTIGRTIGNFWQESFGQIYPALRVMVAEGLVTCTAVEEVGQRSSKVYALTDAGRERLRQWLELPCERQVMRDELLLKIFSGIDAPRGSLERHVRDYREKVLEDLKRYREVEKRLPVAQKGNPALPFYLLTLRQGLLKAEALLRWSEEAVVELERLEKERFGDNATGLPKNEEVVAR
jgi:DNA-binding PadR family transcriptional regulator